MPKINHYYVTKQEVEAQMKSDAASIHAHPRAKVAHAAVVATFKAAGIPETNNFVNKAYLNKPVTMLHPIHHTKETSSNYSVFPVVKEREITEKSFEFITMPSKRVPAFLHTSDSKPVNVTVEKVTAPVYTLKAKRTKAVAEKWFVEEPVQSDPSEKSTSVETHGPFDSEAEALDSILSRMKHGYDIAEGVQVCKRPVDSAGHVVGTGIALHEMTPAMTTLRVAELEYPSEKDIEGYFVIIYDYS